MKSQRSVWSRTAWCTMAAVAHSLLLASCSETNDEPPIFRTLLRCENGLRIALSGHVPDSYRITVEVPNTDSQPFQIQCSLGAPCPNPVFLADFTPSLVRVTVTAGQETWMAETQPDYDEDRPNDPDSSPTCRLSTVEVTIGPHGALRAGSRMGESADPDLDCR
jgi:hypothetical protein